MEERERERERERACVREGVRGEGVNRTMLPPGRLSTTTIPETV